MLRSRIEIYPASRQENGLDVSSESVDLKGGGLERNMVYFMSLFYLETFWLNKM